MRLLLLIIATLLVACTAMSQDPGSDTIGLWFDEEAGINVMEAPSVGTPFSLHVVLHAPTYNPIGGFEAAVAIPDGVVAYDMIVIPGGAQFGDGPTEMVVGLWDPVPADPDLYIARIDCLVMSEIAMPGFFVLGPTDPTSFPDTQSPGYAYQKGDDFPLQPLGYAFDDHAITRFEPGTVMVENHSLTAVKNLFD